ncbi:MAG: hypothetical protein GXC76_10085 [Rhodanobacteraceae bacterium]|nr:hypothetical protein [Rhodanobacteraceae bacterium]
MKHRPASTRFRLHRLARLRLAPLCALVLALLMLLNGAGAAAMPLAVAALSGDDATPAAMQHEAGGGHCAGHAQPESRAGYVERHAHDAACCAGHLCACAPTCAAWLPAAPLPALARWAGEVPLASPAVAYATVAARPLRPPIA